MYPQIAGMGADCHTNPLNTNQLLTLEKLMKSLWRVRIYSSIQLPNGELGRPPIYSVGVFLRGFQHGEGDVGIYRSIVTILPVDSCTVH